MNQIWKRYFLRELAKVFILFIGCFYFLYVLIDYSVHTKDFQSNQLTFLHILMYYGCQFTNRAEILIPIAILISTIKVLTTSNLRHEIVALATGGIPLKTILRPFLWAGVGCAVFLYINSQYLQPFCLGKISAFEDHFFKSSKGNESYQVNALILEDNSLLVYQSYNPNQKAFFDAYWLRNNDRIFRIQSLLPYEKIPFGKYVDSLARASNGEMVKTASYETCLFPEMRFDPKTLLSAVSPPRMQSISQLAHTLGWKQVKFGKMNDREAESATFFYFKLLSPLVCLLAIIGPAPFCLRFSRTLPVYLLYALSIFGIIAFYTLMNSAVILGKSQVVPPILAILLPQTVLIVVLSMRYAKL